MRRAQVVAKTLEGSNQEEKTDWGVMKEKIRADLKRLHREADVAAAADHAGDSGSLARRTPEVPSAYLEDASGLKGGHAERVIVPADEAGVAAALREASAAGIPVTVSGAGTGVAGGRVPFGGWVLSLEKFTRLEIHPGYAVAGAGVLLRDVHAAALASGQLYPPDPTETGASIGGNIACNASGSRSFRYGATRRLGASACAWCWPTGASSMSGAASRSISTRARSRCRHVTKNTAGYLLRPGMDWVDLFVGSEGTLGVVTEATLRLMPAPKAVLAGLVFFPSDDEAVTAVEHWRATASPRMLEYFDRPSLDLLRTRFPEIPAAARAAILFDQEMESEDDPEIDRWLERLEGTGALVRIPGSPPRPTIANASAASATRCPNWSTMPCGAPAR